MVKTGALRKRVYSDVFAIPEDKLIDVRRMSVQKEGEKRMLEVVEISEISGDGSVGNGGAGRRKITVGTASGEKFVFAEGEFGNYAGAGSMTVGVGGAEARKFLPQETEAEATIDEDTHMRESETERRKMAGYTKLSMWRFHFVNLPHFEPTLLYLLS